ncbi:tectonic-1 [Chanos chanos]|uniref:Tectonic-1 n=1 Tax=Chanos chanos TaxID=29144 RepID=A0A6J2UTF8_CHACN|nr:tectonic-1 [Chanos chanos]
MAPLSWVLILTRLVYSLNVDDANIENFNDTFRNINESLDAAEWDKSLNFTEFEENSTLSVSTAITAATEAVTTFTNHTGVLETTTQSYGTANGNLVTDSYEKSTTMSTRSSTSSQPLPLSGVLPPVIDVLGLCPCNVRSKQCDVNCCCDPDCTEELAMFTTCLTEKVIGDPRLCSQVAVSYTLRMAPDGFSQVQSSFSKEVNPNVFCIQSANYEAGLVYATPRVPTEGNFNAIFDQFVGFSFGNSMENSVQLSTEPGNSPGYQYGDAIQTEDEAGAREFFRLPVSAGTAYCLDANPAAFLQDQTSRCMRNFALASDCTLLSALNLQTYSSILLLSGKDKDADVVAVEVAAISLQSLEGTQALVDLVDTSLYTPVLLVPVGTDSVVCNNVVLQVKYVVTYSEAGEIVNVTASFVLGAVNLSMVPVQQEFQITFVQDAANAPLIRFSGNPGYIVRLPLLAGSRTADGIIQSTDPKGSLTVLQSSREQDCLSGSLQRSPVLFGVDMVSGCTLRLEDTANCSVVSELILRMLKGQSFPEYVASFGNSSPENPLDWVPITNKTTPTGTQGCSIPLSYHLDVRWTKYGTLDNPQAQIVSVMELIQTNATSLDSLSSGSSLLTVSSSVSFTDVSAPASPGFKVSPTIDAKLPFDFFFPFV